MCAFDMYAVLLHPCNVKVAEFTIPIGAKYYLGMPRHRVWQHSIRRPDTASLTGLTNAACIAMLTARLNSAIVMFLEEDIS